MQTQANPNPFPSSHPVSDEMRTRVSEELRKIERKYGVKILYACESGSRAWGFASTDSDYDVRFIYVSPVKDYVKVWPGRDVIEEPIDKDLDISGWDLQKALYLGYKSNPTLTEWFQSPIIYRNEFPASQELSNLIKRSYYENPAFWHYLNMAKSNYREHLQGATVRHKKYLYVLRPILAARWVSSGRGVPPMEFAKLALEMLPYDLAAEVQELLRIKMDSRESDRGPKRVALNDFIESELASLAETTFTDPEETLLPPSPGELNDFLFNVATSYSFQMEAD